MLIVNSYMNLIVFRVNGTERDLFDENTYVNLKSISEVMDRVCSCVRNGQNGRTSYIQCNYGTYKNCKYAVGKPFHCSLNPNGQLRRKRDLLAIESMIHSYGFDNKSFSEVSIYNASVINVN